MEPIFQFTSPDASLPKFIPAEKTSYEKLAEKISSIQSTNMSTNMLTENTERINQLLAGSDDNSDTLAEVFANISTAVSAEATTRDTAISTAVSAEATARDTAISTAVSAIPKDINYSLINDAYTAVDNDFLFTDVSNGGFTITLPAGTLGKEVTILNDTGDISSNNITVTPDGDDTIDGNTSYTISSGDVVRLVFSTQWRVL